jgi:peptide chain release factor subunit 1
MDKTKYKLRRILETLKKCRGRHTELISVYIPPGTAIEKIINQLAQEQGTASNIKSKPTRKNVMDALEKIIQHLRLYHGTPKHGLAVFCGNISPNEGQQDIELWAIEPGEPISVKMYRCDQTFVTEPLAKMLAPKSSFGLIAVDNKTATIGMLKGDRYEILDKLTSGYSGKHRAGGQSQRRFERLTDEESHNFKKRIGEHANNIFLPHIQDLSGLIIGGPAATKEEFVDGDYLNHEIKKKIVAVKDITYTDESGIRELVNESQDVLRDVEAAKHRGMIQEFMHSLVKNPEMVVYGWDEVVKALGLGAVEVLLLSENLDEGKIDQMVDKAEATGTQVEIVSDEFEEGNQLWIAFGGVAGILRFRIN